VLWREFGEIRQAVAAELGIEARPLLAQDPGERELALRLAEAGPDGLQVAVANARHAMAVVAAESRRDRSVQWLTGALFSERSWRRAVGATIEDAKRPRAEKRAAPGQPPARSPHVGRVEPMQPADYQEGDQKF